jgi:hypothetical protein
MSAHEDTLLAARFAALAPDPSPGTGMKSSTEQAQLRRAACGLSGPACSKAVVAGSS